MNEQVEIQAIKEMEIYEKLYEFNTEFYSSYKPLMIEQEFINYLRDKDMKYSSNPNKYKLKFFDTLESENE